MSAEVIEIEPVAAEVLASSLSHWQLMDIVYVARHGNMKAGSKRTCGPLQGLIDSDVFKLSCPKAIHRVVVPGTRFQAVLYALERSGRIATHRGMVL